ncbi:MAG: amidohydrolase family protein [Chthoniobacterales bacterium]
MIIRARVVVTMDGEPIENGAVAILGEQIAQVGKWREFFPTANDEVFDLGDHVILPGLINAHCHLDYTMLRGAIPPPNSFTAWIQAINACKATLTRADYLHSIETGLRESAKFGTTTIANLEAFPELIGEVATVPMRTWWLAEMIDVRAPVAVEKVLTEMEARARPPGGVGLAPHAPFTVSENLYRAAADLAARHGIPITTHLAESRNEMTMFRDGQGSLFDFMQSIGRPMDDCGRETPLALMVRRGLLDARWLVAHLNELTPSDFELLEQAPRFHIVNCPRSHAYFGHAPFPYARLRSLGFNICLGTDSLASTDDLSLFSEMRRCRGTIPISSVREILEMVTTSAAAALGEGDRLGRLRAGYGADMIALPFSGPVADALEGILAFEGSVPWRMVNGERTGVTNE